MRFIKMPKVEIRFHTRRHHERMQTVCTVSTPESPVQFTRLIITKLYGAFFWHPELPSYEATKSIYDDTDSTDKCMILFRLPRLIPVINLDGSPFSREL